MAAWTATPAATSEAIPAKAGAAALEVSAGGGIVELVGGMLLPGWERVGVGVGVSVPTGVDGVGATGDVNAGPEGAEPGEDGPLDTESLGVGAESAIDVSRVGGTMMVVSPGGGG
jgi:hypothetical protein